MLNSRNSEDAPENDKNSGMKRNALIFFNLLFFLEHIGLSSTNSVNGDIYIRNKVRLSKVDPVVRYLSPNLLP